MVTIEEQLAQAVRERDEARASVADAYCRGAEAMRFACQQWCRAWENNGDAIADALADLRVEE
jgi:hypothetical protein